MQGLIAARIDGLAQDEKALLQDAAVVGKVFWLGAIAASLGRERWETEERCTRSSGRSSCAASAAQSVTGETEYAFRHRSCATSPTARSRAQRAPRSTGAQPSGSKRSVRRGRPC